MGYFLYEGETTGEVAAFTISENDENSVNFFSDLRPIRPSALMKSLKEIGYQ